MSPIPTALFARPAQRKPFSPNGVASRLYTHLADDGGTQACDVLLRALAEREPGLREHLRRVAGMSVAVGMRLDLTTPELKELRLAAELHDVGKLAIPDAVLQKPGALDPEERELIRQHTLIGERILADSPALRRVGEVVRATHERWDGEGYPDGLAGEAIPLVARIIAVCDAYEAMTSDRAYRTARTAIEALDELHGCSGSQFDPGIVREFLRGNASPRCAPTAAQRDAGRLPLAMVA